MVINSEVFHRDLKKRDLQNRMVAGCCIWALGHIWTIRKELGKKNRTHAHTKKNIYTARPIISWCSSCQKEDLWNSCSFKLQTADVSSQLEASTSSTRFQSQLTRTILPAWFCCSMLFPALILITKCWYDLQRTGGHSLESNASNTRPRPSATNNVWCTRPLRRNSARLQPKQAWIVGSFKKSCIFPWKNKM